MAFLPFILGIMAILNGIGFCKFFVDDGNISAPHDEMVKIIEYIFTIGPDYGYMCHKSKGKLLLGKTGSLWLALKRRDKYVKFGIDIRIISIHPDDYGDAAIILTDEQCNERDNGETPELFEQHRSECIRSKDSIELEYGVKILGSFIGTDKYIRYMLN
jgi:hypothetical protein